MATRPLPWLALLLTLACAGPPPELTGFLPLDTPWWSDPLGDQALVWAREPGVLRPYREVLLEPPVFWLDGQGPGGTSSADLQRLEQAMEAALRDALEPAYPLVSRAGPRTLRLRLAFTHLQLGRPVVNTLTQLPPGRGLSTATLLITGSHLGVGRLGVEAALLDGPSQDHLASFADLHVGRKIDVLEGLTTWGHVEDGLATWARRLRWQLDSLGQGP